MNSSRLRWLDEDWLSTMVIPLLVIFVRICWLWPWLELVRRWLSPSFPAPLLPFLSIPLLFLSGMLITRSALARARNLTLARVWVVAGGLIAIVGLLWWQFGREAYAFWDFQWLWQVALELTHWRDEVPPAFLTMLITAAIWLRAVMDGTRRQSRDDVWGTFRTGVIALILLILASRLDGAGLPLHADRWLVALFAVGLSALALSSLELARIYGHWGSKQQSQIHLNRYWLGSVALVIVVLLATGLALAALVSPGTVAGALSWVGVLLNWLGTLLAIVLTAIAYVIFFLLTPLIEWLQSLIVQSRLAELMQMLGAPQPVEPPPDQPVGEVSPLLVESMRWLGLAGIVLVIIVVIALALRLMRLGDGEDPDETRETVFSGALLQEQLASLWRRWRQRLPHAKRDPYLPLEGEQANRREIRILYRALLTQAKELGHPRLRAQTPTEYDATLAKLVPADEGAWDVMTEGYVAARYGLQAPSSEQVEQMRQAWAMLEGALTSQEAKEVTPQSATQPMQKGKPNDDLLPTLPDEESPNLPL